MKIFVSHISPDVNDKELRILFEAFGIVSDVEIIKDKYTGESRGFGFVVMPDENEAAAAVKRLNGREFKDMILQVNEARTRILGSGSKDRRTQINSIKNPENNITDVIYSAMNY